MKLKRLVGISLSIYGCGLLIVIIIGLWIAPSNELGGVKFAAAGSTAATPAAAGADDSTTSQAGSSAGSSSGNSATPQPPSGPSTPSGQNPSPTPSPTPSPGGHPSPTPSPTPSPAPSPAPSPHPSPPPPPPPSCGNAGGTCTNAQVAGHNSPSNCWVIYSGGYYIVTSFVNQHKGGSSVFNSTTCGHDISGYLNGSLSVGRAQHTHSSDAYSTLNSYYVGRVSG